jgi:hypothetical protein
MIKENSFCPQPCESEDENAYKHGNILTQAIKKDFADLSGVITKTIKSTPSPSPREFVCLCCLPLSAVCCLLSAVCCLAACGVIMEAIKRLPTIYSTCYCLSSIVFCLYFAAAGGWLLGVINFSNSVGKLDDDFELEPSSPMDPPFGTYAPTVSSTARAAVDFVPHHKLRCFYFYRLRFLSVARFPAKKQF